MVDDHDSSVFVFVRRDKAGNEIIVASNFTPVPREHYRFGINQPGKWREILNTDSKHYHGSNAGNQGRVSSEAVGSHGRDFSICLTLPPLGDHLAAAGGANDAADGRPRRTARRAF